MSPTCSSSWRPPSEGRSPGRRGHASCSIDAGRTRGCGPPNPGGTSSSLCFQFTSLGFSRAASPGKQAVVADQVQLCVEFVFEREAAQPERVLDSGRCEIAEEGALLVQPFRPEPVADVTDAGVEQGRLDLRVVGVGRASNAVLTFTPIESRKPAAGPLHRMPGCAASGPARRCRRGEAGQRAPRGRGAGDLHSSQGDECPRKIINDL